ncbi:MAG: PDZ domain-containing protein [Haloferula sp.]
MLLSFDGEALDSRDELKELLKEKAPDDKVVFEMLKDGEQETLTLRLGNRDE